jgi:dihydroorotate dehydrogenase (NAD+) catalytic subunit
MPKQDLAFRSKIINTAGMLGFAPDQRKTPSFDLLGAFITNPISLLPRSPASTRCSIPFKGGVLLHSGFPNPGLVKIIGKYSRQWGISSIPIILHLMVSDDLEMEKILRILEPVEGVTGLELSFDSDCDPSRIVRLLLVALTEWPVIAQLSIEQIRAVLPLVQNDDLSAVSIAPKRGKLSTQVGNGENRLVSGRLYGTSLYAQALTDLEQALTYQLPVIVSGGVTTLEQIDQLILAGAYAVQIDTVLWGQRLS